MQSARGDAFRNRMKHPLWHSSHMSARAEIIKAREASVKPGSQGWAATDGLTATGKAKGYACPFKDACKTFNSSRRPSASNAACSGQ